MEINDTIQPSFNVVNKSNPLLTEWPNSFGVPPFKSVNPEDLEEAFEFAMKLEINDVVAITNIDDNDVTFSNIIEAFDRKGILFRKIYNLYTSMCRSICLPALQSIRIKLAEPLAAHNNRIFMYPGLFAKIDYVFQNRYKLWSLSTEQIRLVEQIHLDFIRNGAQFDEDTQNKYATITEQIAQLQSKFAKNILNDESLSYLSLKLEDLNGLPESQIKSARQAAASRGLTQEFYVIDLSRSSAEQFLTFSENRELRYQIWRLWSERGELTEETDNKNIILDILKLRQQQAKFHGFRSYADYALSDTMTGNQTTVMQLLKDVWKRGKIVVERERKVLLDSAKTISIPKDQSLEPFTTIEPWDWRYYEEKVRSAKYNVDQKILRPYFPLENMKEALFDVAYQLFGIKFKLKNDIETFHSDVCVYGVYDTSEIDNTERLIGLFYQDYFSRPYKKSGCWNSKFQLQSRNIDSHGTPVIAIIMNSCNFSKGDPTLLTMNDVKSMFHEFGLVSICQHHMRIHSASYCCRHALHCLLSNVSYNRISGSQVVQDYVEFPSKLMEHWSHDRTVLKKHARHYITGEPIPDELLDRMLEAKKFSQGSKTIEFTASALLDQALHTAVFTTDVDDDWSSSKSTDDNFPNILYRYIDDVTSFEKEILSDIGMPEGLALRHRPTHFSHLFASNAYAASYYIYLYADILAADGFAAFKEKNDVFDQSLANKLRKFVFSAGNSVDPKEAYSYVRGRQPNVDAMLIENGLVD